MRWTTPKNPTRVGFTSTPVTATSPPGTSSPAATQKAAEEGSPGTSSRAGAESGRSGRRSAVLFMATEPDQTTGPLFNKAVDAQVIYTIGPSYKEVAAKYRKDKSAEATLIKKVKAGGKGVWGETPMPPNAHVKDDDIKSIVQWILTLK